MTGAAAPDPATRPELRALRRRPLFAPLAVPALGLLLGVGVLAMGWAQLRTTTVIVVRHAEKLVDGSADPALAPEGAARAARLARQLAPAGLEAIYVTPTRRSRDTAAPLATATGTPLVEVDGKDAVGLVARIRAEHRGGTVLVVGHSNTIGPIVRALGGEAPLEVPESDYDEVFVVSEPTLGPTTTLHLRGL